MCIACVVNVNVYIYIVKVVHIYACVFEAFNNNLQ